MVSKRSILALLVSLLVVTLLLFQAGCRSAEPRRDPTGEIFPAVSGESLRGDVVRLPADLAGSPAVLLVGYEMEAQFDIDRWILGLLQAEVPVPLLELPTIDGMLPGLYAGFIDEGMRSGIPEEDWGVVVTLYGDDAERVRSLTGDEGGRNARVLLLDEDGRVIWFHDRGYSAGELLELDEALRAR